MQLAVILLYVYTHTHIYKATQHLFTEYTYTVFFFFKLSLQSAVSKMTMELRKTLWLTITMFFYSYFLSVINI